MRIQHNIMAMNSYRNYSNNTSALSKNLEKLSSGYKINRAGDDAAGLAISEKMRAQITGLTQAQANAKSGINLVQTAEGALTEVHDMLNRMVKLADQSANGTYDDDVDRANLQKEVTQLQSEIDRIADSSNFNGIKLLNGDLDDRATTTFSGAAGTNASAVDAIVKAQGKVTIAGTETNLSFEMKVGTEGAKIGTDGKVTIELTKAKTYSAADIQNLIKNADVTALNADDQDAVKAALANATVSGKGVTGNTGDTSLNLADAGGTRAEPTGKGLTLQIGDTSDDFNKLTVSVQDMHTKALGIDAANISIASQSAASAAVDKIKTAINTVSSVRGDLGATQNRLDHTINNLSVMTENIQDAESTIRDTDVAEEMMAYTKNNILVQSAQAMLAQANQVPQGVLQLLQ